MLQSHTEPAFTQAEIRLLRAVIQRAERKGVLETRTPQPRRSEDTALFRSALSGRSKAEIIAHAYENAPWALKNSEEQPEECRPWEIPFRNPA